ncbi:AAA family ATPase [Erythrobacteraceae bacterium WH01K]|nr:AAA family ATPase [Erythrobacteraceae bacterium WH01K]
MKIETLQIDNFRGIRSARFDNLGDTVVIAGPNGSGKSCVFDAIRFLKSIYGGYQQNEVQQWFGEFQVNPSRLQQDLIKLFNDKNKPLQITSAFTLSDDEKSYINTNAHDLLSQAVWRTILPDAFNYGFYTQVRYSAQFRERQPEVDQKVAELMPKFKDELSQDKHIGEIISHPHSGIQVRDSILLSVLFNTYDPPHIGVIDYHGPMRLYTRDNVQNVTLHFDQSRQEQKRQSSLYNYNSKYGNVKTELASAFIQDMLSAASEGRVSKTPPLTDTLKELFDTFFPDKKFLGPQPTGEGNLNFPVQVGAEATHDLDELSSGEKEVLYGYLRMRNTAPKDSIILLDEPELHLNPRLIRGLPQFYRKHLTVALNNQMWLVSHSDALLREVVGKTGYDVFHMVPSTSAVSQQGQLKTIKVGDAMDAAIVDLVGDVAAYKPGAKAVILEGGGDAEFDIQCVSTLFPEFAAEVNLLSGTNKVRVKALLETLASGAEKGIDTKFYAIVDRDTDEFDPSAKEKVDLFSWDVYHIENYLLEPQYVLKAMHSLGLGKEFTEDKVLDQLRECAREIRPELLRMKLQDHVNDTMIRAINIGVDKSAEDLAKSINASIQGSVKRINELTTGAASEERLAEFVTQENDRLDASFADGSWRGTIPGRPILKRFVSRVELGVAYEPFRNLIITRMADDGFEPEGMQQVLRKVHSW